MTGTRIKWIDFSKGIGILLVVYVHATFYAGFYFSKWINCFFMPLFFISAGLVFSLERFSIKRTAKTVLGAYYFWGAMGIAFGSCVDFLNSSFSLSALGKHIFYYLFGIKPYYNSPLWFLTSLFVAKVLYWLISIITKKRLALKALFVAASAVLGVLIGIFRGKMLLPYRLDIGMSMMVFIFIGEISKGLIYKISSLKKIIIAAISVASLGSCVLFGIFLNGEVSVDAGIYSFYPWLVISASAGTLFVLTLGMLLTSKKNPAGTALVWLGNRSLTVQCTHVLVLFVLSAGLAPFSLSAALNYFVKYVICICFIVLICRFSDMAKKRFKRGKNNAEA